MKARMLFAMVCLVALLVLCAGEIFAQCGRQVVSQQATVQPAQPAVSVFQLPAQALVQTQPSITASQSASIGGSSALAVPQQAAATCTDGSCQQSVVRAQQTTVQPATVQAALVARPSVLQSLRANRRFGVLNRPQTIRQRTVTRG